jgi:hypothetical protein
MINLMVAQMGAHRQTRLTSTDNNCVYTFRDHLQTSACNKNFATTMNSMTQNNAAFYRPCTADVLFWKYVISNPVRVGAAQYALLFSVTKQI